MELAKQTVLKLFVAFAGLILSGNATAETYFVNSNGGNDNYSGTAPSFIAGANGPWQTLARLANANLMPNDTVYLACNGVWNETLKVRTSGANATPITITAGPGNCIAQPSIEGAISVPAHQWVKHSGSIYRAKLPIELISNPNPGANLSGWTNWAANGDATIAVDNACPGQTQPCMAFTSGTSNSIAISNDFAISGGVEYTAGVQIRAPAGSRIKVVLRRGGPTYEPIAPVQWVTAAGVWQSVGFIYRAGQSVKNARMDVEVPAGRLRVNLREAHVRRTTTGTAVIAAFVDGLQVRRAHHPNFGQYGNTNSPYAAIASAGGKTVLDTSGLALPIGAVLTAGLGLTMRTVNWAIEERIVQAVNGRHLTLSDATVYDLEPGFGYYMTGALWMLDSPGEWFYDHASTTLYVWMPDGASPLDRVSITDMEYGVDFRNMSNVVLKDIAVRRVGTGVTMTSTTGASVSGLLISDIAGSGIRADNCVTCSVLRVDISRTGLDAVSAWNPQTNGFIVRDSVITDSGASGRTDGWRMLPRPSYGAIYSQAAATRVEGNTIMRAAKLGIHVGTSSSVTDNYVGETCLMLNDCGGIYVGRSSNRAAIVGNVVENVIGNLSGLPGTPLTHAVGIYLDDLNSGSIVSNNTVTGADIGVQLHNANNATISDNVVFGNRRHQLWLQERTRDLRTNGDVFGNRVLSNVLVPSASGPALYLQSEIGDTADFATYSSNHYSALFSPRVIGERSPTSASSFSVVEWQSSGREANPNVTQPVGYVSFLAGVANLIPNGDLAAGKTGWTSWNQTAPLATATVSNCGFANCIQLQAGASQSLLSSWNFSVNSGQWYRVTFDAITSKEGQPINVVVRRGGGGNVGYDYLMPAAESLAGHTSWHRYTFTFQANKTVVAGDPATLDLGARVDFERNLPNSTLTIARLEMVALTPAQAPLQVKLLLNQNRSSQSVTCATLEIDEALCGSFVQLRDNLPVAWPATIGPLTGSPVYSRDTSLTDGDGDGIADQQDACPTTPLGLAANARGCAITQ